ncbi:16S rRNA (guanine(966)-N(2))-methyltransferase RsmD [Paucibacter sp. hw1]|uniref:16S rRNA (Guanine(966)-N(2))-methyltransferase RsmD n=2 Tax=Roseateles koreensis TaxID=2987526 RepID=A0ABT5KS80_9BURK|nr:16S rRNA (guanine(966)-N(2))-methyltransferase RsmD [Roseateles koreensis]MDC8785784.1 16S rRNA (guanine(966)-N(2))-methyltransferase RsmD [Roseateles koreensis]
MGAREVRIIGGDWKRSKLPVADKPGLRPTPDRVRETLFNWLGQTLEGWRVLDAFAGSGALGFEAASRAATEVLLLERDPQLARSLQASAQRLKATNIRVECTDAIGWMSRQAAPAFELVLLDPPFDLNLFLPALKAAVPLLAPGGLIYLEAGELIEAPADLGLEPLRSGRAGAVHFQLLRRSG